jgi:hypothetical protein
LWAASARRPAPRRSSHILTSLVSFIPDIISKIFIFIFCCVERFFKSLQVPKNAAELR